MPTPYLTRETLADLLGATVLANAEAATTANIEAVIVAQCALADGYVSAQVSLPPSAQAQAQVAPIVAELVHCALYAGSGGEVNITRRKFAMQQLKDIASGQVRLHVEPVADDPDTLEDESATGAAAGSAGRWASRSQLSGGVSDAGW